MARDIVATGQRSQSTFIRAKAIAMFQTQGWFPLKIIE